MSNRKTKNLLTPLRRKGNKYIARNAVPKSMDIASDSSAPPSPIPHNYNEASHRHTYSYQEAMDNPMISNTYTHPSLIRSQPDPTHALYEPELNTYLAPHKIRYPLEIIFIKGGTEEARTRHSILNCTTQQTSIEKTLMYILNKEKIKIPLDHFLMGFRERYNPIKHKKQKQKDVEMIQSIYDYQLAGILHKDIKTFTLRQVVAYEDPTTTANKSISSFTKAGNKARMENRYQALKTAELTIRNNLRPTEWAQLQRNKALLLGAKYDLGVRDYPWHIVKENIDNGLNESDTNHNHNRNHNQIQSVPATITPQQPSGNVTNSQILSNLNDLNSNIKSVVSVLCTLVKQQPQQYAATHGGTTSVSATRFNPTTVASIPRNIAAPPLPPLPTAPELNLPTISYKGNGKEEAE